VSWTFIVQYHYHVLIIVNVLIVNAILFKKDYSKQINLLNLKLHWDPIICLRSWFERWHRGLVSWVVELFWRLVGSLIFGYWNLPSIGVLVIWLLILCISGGVYLLVQRGICCSFSGWTFISAFSKTLRNASLSRKDTIALFRKC